MKKLAYTLPLFTLLLGGCARQMTLAEVERADDATCKGATDYAICRQNIMSQRRDQTLVRAAILGSN